MAYEIPDKLIELQREFFAAHAHLLEVSANLPSGRAALTDEQSAKLEAARAAELDLIRELYSDKWRKGMDNERLYRQQLQEAARKAASE